MRNKFLMILFILAILTQYTLTKNIYSIFLLISIIYMLISSPKRYLKKEIYTFNSKFKVLVFGFFLLYNISTIINILFGNIILYNIGKLIFIDILVILIYVNVANTKEINIEKFIKFIFFISLILNLISIYEIITKHSLFIKFAIKEFPNPDSRSYSVFIHPIIYANFLVCIFWINKFIKGIDKRIVFINQILVIVNLYYTKSRSSWIALIITIFIYIIPILSKKIKINKKTNLITLGTLIVVIISLIVFNQYVSIIFNTIASKFSSLGLKSNDISQLQRVGAISLILNKVINKNLLNIIIGSGFGSVSNVMRSETVYLKDFYTTDNQYLDIIYDIGIIGIVIYILIIILVVKEVIKIYNKKPEYSIALYSFLSISICMFFYTSFGWTVMLFLMLYFMLIIVYYNEKKS